MANLTVRNVDDTIVQALERRAKRNGVSVEAEHRNILEKALLHPPQKSFAEVLSQMPDVGKDSDFERMQNDALKMTKPQNDISV